jgi:hypothetical protein
MGIGALYDPKPAAAAPRGPEPQSSEKAASDVNEPPSEPPPKPAAAVAGGRSFVRGIGYWLPVIARELAGASRPPARAGRRGGGRPLVAGG